MIANIVLAAILLLIAGCAVRYIYKAKKRGAHCIGCSCGNKCDGSCCSSKNK